MGFSPVGGWPRVKRRVGAIGDRNPDRRSRDCGPPDPRLGRIGARLIYINRPQFPGLGGERTGHFRGRRPV